MSQQHIMKIDGREYSAQVKELSSDRALVVVDGREYAVEFTQLGHRPISPGDLTVHGGLASPAPRPAPAPAATPAAAPRPPAPRRAPAADAGAIVAPMPGSVFKLSTREGAQVEAGQVLLVMEAMKMEAPIQAPYAGTVKKVFVREGDNVREGDLLVEVARPEMTTL